tara:strand:+ start:4032 stop:4250 length:219 start_codon:yes stop_codon:yes gene_type:complete
MNTLEKLQSHHKYKESRRRARLAWSRSEHGKTWSRNYMREYRKLPHVKAAAREYYIKKILKEGIDAGRENHA